MKLQINKIIVNSETDFIENEVKKVRADITIACNLYGDNNTREVPISIEVISLNSDSGDSMDLQRQTACENLLNNF